MDTCTCPYQRFATPSRNVDAWLRAVVGRYPFDVELFHLLLQTGLSRRFLKLGYVALSRSQAEDIDLDRGLLHARRGHRACDGMSPVDYERFMVEARNGRVA
jgi:hypothetical protein